MSVIYYPTWSKIILWIIIFFNGYLVSTTFRDESDLIFPIGLAVFVSIVYFFFLSIASKKVYLKKDGLSIERIFKKKFVSIQDLQKAIIFDERIEVYDTSNHKITKISRICKGYYGLEKWFANNGITIEHRNF